MQDPQKTPHCVPTETIALLALGCEDQALDMIHISECERCSALLRDALEDLPRDPTGEESSIASSIAPPPMPKPQVHSTRWPLAIAAALFVLVSASAYRLVNPESEKTTLTAQMASVYSTHRSMDLRIAGSAYAGVRIERSENAKSPYAGLALTIEEGLEKNPGHANLLRGKGRLALFEGRYDEAIAILGSIGAANDPEVETDLAAAYFQRGRRRDSREDREQAFARYQAYAKAHPSDTAAAFNLALVASETRPVKTAVALYHQYMILESSPEWKLEAQVRLNRLREKPAVK